jgi:hypothetical protein
LFSSANVESLKVRSKYLDTLSEGSYISLLFLTVMRELYVDTERPVDLSALTYDELELEDVEDDESKLQGNIAYIFSHALNYASYPIRSVYSFSLLTIGANGWILEIVSCRNESRSTSSQYLTNKVTSPTTFQVRLFSTSFSRLKRQLVSRSLTMKMSK